MRNEPPGSLVYNCKIAYGGTVDLILQAPGDTAPIGQRWHSARALIDLKWTPCDEFGSSRRDAVKYLQY